MKSLSISPLLLSLLIFILGTTAARANDAIRKTTEPVPDKFGFINKTGSMVIPPQFNYTSEFENGMAVGTLLDESGKPKRYSTIDKTGRKVLEQDPSVTHSGLFKDGLCSFSEGGKWGYADQLGQVKIQPQFKTAKDFEYGYAEVTEDNYTPMVIDKSGKVVIDTSKPPTNLSSDGFQIIKLSNATYCRGARTGLARFHDSVACVHDGRFCGYVDKNGSFVLPMQDCNGNDFSEGLAFVRLPQSLSFIDVHGKIVFSLASRQVEAGDFHEGRAPVLVRSQGADAQGQPLCKIGFIDRQGKVVIPSKILPERTDRLDGVRFFDGLCRVFNGTKYGFIDKTGKLAIPYIYRFVADFHEGLAAAVPDLALDKASDSSSLKTAANVSPISPDAKTALLEERVKLSGDLSCEPFFKPVAARLSLLLRLVELDEQLFGDSKALSEDLTHLADSYEENNQLDGAEKTWKRYLATKDGMAIEPLKILLTRQHKFKELEDFLKTRISAQEKIDIAAELVKPPENMSKEDLAAQHPDFFEREKRMKTERLEAQLLEQILDLGDVYYATRQYPLAQEQYDKACKLAAHKFPTAVYDCNDDGRWRLALFYAEQNDDKAACDKFHEIMSIAVAAGKGERVRNELLDTFLALLYRNSPSNFARELNTVPNYVQKFPSPTWGFIDESGKTVISGQYADAGSFKDGLANVAIVGRGWGYIDRTNNWKIKPQFYEAGPFNEGVATVSQSLERELPAQCRYAQTPGMKATGLIQNLSYGFIDASGKYMVEPRYFKASTVSQGLSAVAFWHGQMCANFGYVDTRGQIVMPPLAMASVLLKSGLAQIKIRHKSANVSINGTMKGVDRDYDIRLPVGAFTGWLSFYSNYLVKQKLIPEPAQVATTEFLNPCPAQNNFDAPFGFVDMHGETLIKPQHTFARPFTEGLAAVQKKDKWGFINVANKLMVPAIYDDAASFDGGCARVQQKDSWGLINKSGKIILRCKYKSISDFSEGFAVIISEPEATASFVDTRGNISFASQFVAARPFKNGFAAVKSGSGWGFIDKKGELAIPAVYREVRDFSDGMAAVAF